MVRPTHISERLVPVVAAFAACALLAYSLLRVIGISPAFAVDPTVTVTPSNMQGWIFQQEIPAGTGSIVSGPLTPPLGAGSARLQVSPSGNAGGAEALSLYGVHVGTKLSAITQLTYSTYQSTGTSLLEIALQFDIDSDVTDGNNAYQGRLVFEPYFTDQPAASAVGQWQTWHPMQGKWWGSGSTGRPISLACPQSAPCTWAQILQMFPNAGLNTTFGGMHLRAGSGWGTFDGNVDNFTFDVARNATTYDFEPDMTSSSSAMSTSSVSTGSSVMSASSMSATGTSLSSLSASMSSMSAMSSVLSASSSSLVACTLPTANLAGYWKFDEGTGTTTADSSGGGRDGALVGGPMWAAGTPSITPNPSALAFDGADDHVRVAGTGAFNYGTSEFTVSTWMKASSGGRSVLGNFNGSNRGWGLYVYGNSNVNFFGYGNVGINDTSHAATVLDNQWHQLTGVYKRTGSGLTIETYVDGVLKGTNTVAVGDISSNNDLLFGRYLAQPNFNGSLDDIRVYARALTPAEIAQLAGNCASTSASSMSTTGSSVMSASSTSMGTSVSSVLSSASSISSLSMASSVMSSSMGPVANGPMCNGQASTIYVMNGMIFGGPQNGQQYTGTLNGTSGDDVIYGTGGPDNISGVGGNDTVCAGDGDDVITAGGGNNWIHTANGNDRITVGGGNNTVFGSDGDDQIVAGAGANTVDGGNGNDTVQAGDGGNTIKGDNGDDRLTSGSGNDSLDGGGSFDVCSAGGGTNAVVNCEA